MMRDSTPRDSAELLTLAVRRVPKRETTVAPGMGVIVDMAWSTIEHPNGRSASGDRDEIRLVALLSQRAWKTLRVAPWRIAPADPD